MQDFVAAKRGQQVYDQKFTPNRMRAASEGDCEKASQTSDRLYYMDKGSKNSGQQDSSRDNCKNQLDNGQMKQATEDERDVHRYLILEPQGITQQISNLYTEQMMAKAECVFR